MPKFCPKCGNQIIDDASLFCNNCGSQLSTSQQEVTQPAITQPIRKKSDDNEKSNAVPIMQFPLIKNRLKLGGLIFIILGVTILSLILLAFISALVFPPIPTAKNVVGYTSKVTTPTPTVTIRDPSKLTTEDTIDDRKKAVMVYSIQKTDHYSYYSDIFKETQFETASPGKIFVFVDAVIKNIGAQSIYASPTSFSITDSKGYKYDPDYRYFGDDGLKTQELYLNQKTEGRILFTIPSSATGLRLQYEFGDMYSGPNLVTWPFD